MVRDCRELSSVDAVLDVCRDPGLPRAVVGELCLDATVGCAVTLKLKFANFRVIRRSRTVQMQIRTRTKLDQLGNALLEPLFSVARGIRLLGVSLSSLAEEQAEREPEFGLPR